MSLDFIETVEKHVCQRTLFAVFSSGDCWQYVSGHSVSFQPSSNALEYSHPCLTEFIGNINCTEFITEGA